MVEDDKADEEADRVVQEVTKVLLDLGVLRKHIDDILEKSHTNVSSAVLHAFILVHWGDTRAAHWRQAIWVWPVWFLQDNVTHEKNTLKTYWRKVLPIYSYQPMAFLQCDVIVSPQCTKKSACITALVTYICAVKHAPSLVHWGKTMTSHWRKANFYKIISCFAWVCILKSLSEEASIPHMAQEGMATANSV